MGTKISALSTGTTANSTDKIPIERSGANYYITPAMITAGIGSGGAVGLIVRARNSTGTVVADATTAQINFDTEEYDPYNQFTTGASCRFVPGTAAYYDFHIEQAFVSRNGSAWVAGGLARMDVYIDGGPVASAGLDSVEGSANNAYVMNLSGCYSCSVSAGSTVDFRMYNSTGKARQLESDVAVSIYRVT